MKQILFSALILLPTTALSQEGSHGVIELAYDLFPRHVVIEEHSDYRQVLKNTAIVGGLGFSFNAYDNFHFEPLIRFSFLPNTSAVNVEGTRPFNAEEIQRSYDNYEFTENYRGPSEFQTYYGQFGFNLISRQTDRFGIGGGVFLNAEFTSKTNVDVTDQFLFNGTHYELHKREEERVSFSTQRLSISVPIVVRYYQPIKNKYLRFNFEGHLSNYPRMLLSLAFCL